MKNESQNDTDTSRVVLVRVPMETHKAIRIRVAEEDTSIQQWVLNLMERELATPRAKGKKNGMTSRT